MSRRTAAITVAVCLLSPSIAGGQAPEDVARADALFSAAKQLRDAGQAADACPKFAESKRLAPGVGVSLYLADCYERIEHTTSAWTEFRNAERLATERNDKRADLAHARAQALESKLSGITIVVPPAVGRDAEVLLDGTRIPPEEWNAAIAVDPGDHVVAIHAAGRTPQTLTAHVGAGSRQATASFDPTPGGDAAPTLAVETHGEPQPPPSDANAARRLAGIGLIAVGAIGVGLGTTFALYDSRTRSTASSCSTPPDDAPKVAETISFAAGGLALLAGIALTVASPSKAGVGIVAAPTFVAGGGGAVVRGSF
jgi:hypothetical protein